MPRSADVHSDSGRPARIRWNANRASVNTRIRTATQAYTTALDRSAPSTTPAYPGAMRSDWPCIVVDGPK
jgi:hypothetical protein